ncbi:putative ABC transporter ATP-binding protein YbiT [Nymphon striatum]|nr:putative ABC transporter ATP-binding protein YbiT [Nymphon striatum]
MGDKELWEIKCERERIYALPEMSDADGIKVGHLEAEFAEMDGYTAESRAGDILLNAGIEEDLHFGLMSEVAPGRKLRVLLAQALFANPDILLLDEPTNNLDIDTINWLSIELNKRTCTMVIISHDRHFLNSVCTHMADIDYGELRIYPGNYEYFLAASSLIREQLLAGNSKKSAEIEELQDFVNRFGANASKAKQASSRAKKLDKIKLDEVKSSSRMTPTINFKQHKKLHRNALILENISHGFNGDTLFTGGDFILEAGTRLSVLGENGTGKTTFLRCLMEQLTPNGGSYKWSENAVVGYCPQDNTLDFDNDLTLFDWMMQWRTPKHDDLKVRGLLGRLLFTEDDFNKKAKVCSGGEKNRLLFGKLMMQDTNVLILDEPTNHMDMEAIEALNNALKVYEGTLIFRAAMSEESSDSSKEDLNQSDKNIAKNSEENPYINNPLHGVGLKTVLEELVSQYGFDILYAYLNINCFKVNPSIPASAKFLKKTDWAREKVEVFYLYQYKNLPKVSSEQFTLPPRERIVPSHQKPREPAVLSIEEGERLQQKRAKNVASRNSYTGDRKSSNKAPSKSYNERRSKRYTSDSSHGGSRGDSHENTDESKPAPAIDPWGNFKPKK